MQRKVQINNQHSIMFAEMQKRFSGAFIFNDLLDAFVSKCRFFIDRRYPLIYSSLDSILWKNVGMPSSQFRPNALVKAAF